MRRKNRDASCYYGFFSLLVAGLIIFGGDDFSVTTIVVVDATATTSCFATNINHHQQQQQQSNHALLDQNNNNHELFSVAPMMGHTNQHYRYYFRNYFSQCAYLYTEMIPAIQIVQAFRRCSIVSNNGKNLEQQHSLDPNYCWSTDEILKLAHNIKDNPNLEYERFFPLKDVRTLYDLIGIDNQDESLVLQLGGNDPNILAMASTIAVAIGNYKHINLNCGCPSNAVASSEGRMSGAALMKDPSHVAHCVERMNHAINKYVKTVASTSCNDKESFCFPQISVKHRIGIRDASTFDATLDKQMDDKEYYKECKHFVHAITQSGAVSKCQVHARLALLGDFDPQQSSSSSSLWIPGGGTMSDNNNNQYEGKINHKRVQDRAKRIARQGTIKNRNIPPLRPNIVYQLAQDFPHIQFITNGGITDFHTVQDIAIHGKYGNSDAQIVGSMVGRSVINHPCSFSQVDTLWDKEDAPIKLTRGKVLQKYVEYCDIQEERYRRLGATNSDMQDLTRKLVAVPFHLFVGENGNASFQRQIKKLITNKKTIKASSILIGAATLLPHETIHRKMDQFVPWSDITKYMILDVNEAVHYNK